jgi:hypothetical protein
MSRTHKCVTIAAIVAASAALAGMSASGATAAKRTECPADGTPAPGSTITGGLEVDGGFCDLHDVIVHGGITVDRSPESAGFNWNNLGLNGSTVNGGITLGEGSEMLVGFDPFTGNLTHNPSTINGGITVNDGIGFFLNEATVTGGLTVNGFKDPSFLCDGDPFCFYGAPVCANEIYGNITIRDENVGQIFIGDPKEQFFANAECDPNTIHGSVFFIDSNFTRASDGEPSELEGNAITGSVHLDHSTAEVNENIIGGSLLCVNGSVVHEPPPPDVAGNTVRGKDTCD